MIEDDDEAARVAALRRYCRMDAPAEPELEGILRTVATVAGVSTATINLLDDEVQVNYVTLGFDGGSCPKSDSMCNTTILERRSQYVCDATHDARFVRNPWVDGRLGSIRFYASAPIVTHDAHIIGTLCVFDSSPHQLDAIQQRAMEDLAAQVMALLERRRLAREAHAATEAKSRFLAAVSHEIRTPLGGVLGMLDVLLTSHLDSAQRRHATIARRSAETLLALLDGVLDLSKGEAGHVVLAEVPFDLVGLVEDVVDVLSALRLRHDIGLSYRVEGEIPAQLVGDPNRLRQVLVNLVGNALKFTTAGSVEVVVRRAGAATELVVRDTGEGIAPEELSRLFQPFAQGAAGELHGGTGLGLFICRELIDLMGGEIRCESALGVGTTMTVSIPLEEPEARPEAAGELPCVRTLVVDDDDVSRLVAQALLGSAGAEVDVAPDGATALRRVAEASYDLVLVDIELPDMDGVALTKALRALPSDVAIHALSGHVGGEKIAAGLAAGMDGVLTKPLRQADVEALLGGVLTDARP
ncbi:MAG: response regulator [Myxococcales bacterium]|nr:response regulator [Myxococcales bacterium]